MGVATPKRTQAQPAIVIGAGVSGCAAALALASHMVPVLLLSSGLDSMGLPGYGPGIMPAPLEPEARSTANGDQERTSVLGLAPAAELLERVWMATARGPLATGPDRGGTRPASDGSKSPDVRGLVVVDRRSVSLGVKWLVENQPLIEIRQGLATAVEAREADSLLVRTAFGEELIGRCVVLAVGLALDGRILVGEQTLAGGRYGEVSADELYEDLARKGVGFTQVEVEVGARLRSLALEPAEEHGVFIWGDGGRVGRVLLRRVELGRLAREAHSGGGGRSSALFGPGGVVDSEPPSPYVDPTLPAPVGYVWSDSQELEESDFVLLPDGLITGEWYLQPDAVVEVLSEALTWESAQEYASEKPLGIVSRPAHTVVGKVVQQGEGQVLPGIWAAGQVARASGYAESLGSGWRVGELAAHEYRRKETS